MPEVVIAGGGPAGAMAAIILARAGVGVRVFERARFPRHKLCGDTLNPGALDVLARHVDLAGLLHDSDAIDGMVLTGPGGARVEGRYGAGIAGRAVTRRVLDQWLLAQAVAAGAQVEEGVAVTGVTSSSGAIDGVTLRGHDGRSLTHAAALVVGADGRRSTLAFGRHLAHQPLRPRRWAIGAYFTGVTGLTSLGEMHVREDHYIGVAPVPGGLVNACLVVPHRPGSGPIARPDEVLMRRLRADRALAPRFEQAHAVAPAVMLGPMAVDSDAAGEPGLLLAGDAAGFIDPMTGDGLRLALAGAEMAAEIALGVLEGRVPLARAHADLLTRRREGFRCKWRFNRTLRALVASPRSVGLGAVAARHAPALFQHVIRYAGDVGARP